MKIYLRSLLFLGVLGIANVLHATPGDIGCSTTMVDGRKVEVVVWREVTQGMEWLSKMLINLDGEQAADLGQPHQTSEETNEVNPDGTAFYKYFITGYAEGNSAKIEFLKPGIEMGINNALLSVTVPSRFVHFENMPVYCEL